MLRTEFQARGIDALQCYGTADLGLIAYESFAPDGSVCEGMVLDEGIIVELVHPGTGDPVPPGEVGEVVVTTLTPEYPLIRFATGDLSALLPGPSPCGRTNHRIRGWLGRADQSVKVRGMFVHPVQVAEIVRRHKSIIRARLVVERPQSADQMTLLVEMGEPAEPAAAIAETVQAVTKLRGSVTPGAAKAACRTTARSSRTGGRSDKILFQGDRGLVDKLRHQHRDRLDAGPGAGEPDIQVSGKIQRAGNQLSTLACARNARVPVKQTD